MLHPCLWRWWLADAKGKLKPSRWRMTEEEARARHPGCTKLEGPLQVRQIDVDAGHSMGAARVRREHGAMVQAETL
jgi:hypothetical protein